MASASPRLRRIWIAYSINLLGTWFGYIALAVAVYNHTHSAIATAGLFISAQFAPALVVPAVVARMEASSRKSVLSRLYLVEAASAAALAILLWHFWLPAILVLVAIDGTAAQAASALLRATAARIGEHDAAESSGARESTQDLQAVGARKANAALNTAFMASIVAGPPLAGALVASAGAPVALLVDALSFAACGAMLLTTQVSAASGDRSVRARLTELTRHFRQVPQLRLLMIIEGIALVFFASISPVEVVYAQSTLHAGATGYGALTGAWGVGAVVGSVIFRRSVRRPLGPLLSGGTLAVGVAYLGIAAAPTLLAACVVSVLGGIGNGVQWASAISAIQFLTPDALLGRMMAAVQSLGSFCPGIGFLVGGVIVSLSGPRVAFWVAGSAAVAMTLVFVRVSAGGLGASQGPSNQVLAGRAEPDPEVLVPTR